MSYIIVAIAIPANLYFTQFLPKHKRECLEWKLEGEKEGKSLKRGVISIIICVCLVIYGVGACFLLLVPDTSCLEIVGGEGCRRRLAGFR